MSEPKLIYPMLENFAMGDPISDHAGVRCCPAMNNIDNGKYIVKIISSPASQTQLDALLLTGAFPDAQAAQKYFEEIANGVVEEIKVLQALSRNEGFLAPEKYQLVNMPDGQTGCDVYMLTPYGRTLDRQLHREPLTHLAAVNLGLDLCSALAACRRAGYLYVDLKPTNIYVTSRNEYCIGDLGFINLNSLKYASLPDRYRSVYTAPEVNDAFAYLNTTLDVYAVGLILYQAYNNGALPFAGDVATAEKFAPPAYADYEISEIILKACDPDPEQRWADPMQLGQALVSYMQRNGVNDTPIVVPVSQEEPLTVAEPIGEEIAAPVEEPMDLGQTQVFTAGDIITMLNDDPEIAPQEPVAVTEEAAAEESAEVSAEITAEEPVADTEEVSAEVAVEEIPEMPSEEPEEIQMEAPVEPLEVSEEVTEASAAEPEAVQVVEPEAHVVEEQITIAEILAAAEIAETAEEAPAVEAEEPQQAETAEPTETSEEDISCLTFLTADEDETAQEIDAKQIGYEEVTDEVSQMLNAIDELAAHPVPEPVVAPEAVDVPIPEPITLPADESAEAEETEENTETDPENADEQTEESSELAESNAQDDEGTEQTEEPKAEEETETVGEDFYYKPHKRRRRWIRNIIIILLLLALIGAGYFYYKNYYLQTIDDLQLEHGKDSVTVTVITETDISNLYVTCSAYGPKYKVALSTDGKATFDNLDPGVTYTITVGINGFHDLEGKTTATHHTPEQINVSQITFDNGPKEGSIIVRFSMETPDSNIPWKIRYSAPGEATKELDIENHTRTLENLTVGKEYTVEIFTEQDLVVGGNYIATVKVDPLIYAQDLKITALSRNQLTVAWKAPTGTHATGWTVRCYNQNDYDTTVTTTETTYTFKDLDHTQAYFIEVCAEGQTLTQRTSIEANTVTIDGFDVEPHESGAFTLTWQTESQMPKGGWILNYTISDNVGHYSIECQENSVTLETPVPGRTYTFDLVPADGCPIFTETYTHEVPSSDYVSDYGGFHITGNMITLSMCLRPDTQVWSADDLEEEDYTNAFLKGEKAGFATRIGAVYSVVDEDPVQVLYVITDTEGNIISAEAESRTWKNLWDYFRGTLNIPSLPDDLGDYTMNIYFNGGHVSSVSFSMIEERITEETTPE